MFKEKCQVKNMKFKILGTQRRCATIPERFLSKQFGYVKETLREPKFSIKRNSEKKNIKRREKKYIL